VIVMSCAYAGASTGNVIQANIAANSLIEMRLFIVLSLLRFSSRRRAQASACAIVVSGEK
jgi:hypothetical protein